MRVAYRFRTCLEWCCPAASTAYGRLGASTAWVPRWRLFGPRRARDCPSRCARMRVWCLWAYKSLFRLEITFHVDPASSWKFDACSGRCLLKAYARHANLNDRTIVRVQVCYFDEDLRCIRSAAPCCSCGLDTGGIWLQHGPQGRSGLPHKVRAGHRHLQEPTVCPRARQTAQPRGASSACRALYSVLYTLCGRLIPRPFAQSDWFVPISPAVGVAFNSIELLLFV